MYQTMYCLENINATMAMNAITAPLDKLRQYSNFFLYSSFSFSIKFFFSMVSLRSCSCPSYYFSFLLCTSCDNSSSFSSLNDFDFRSFSSTLLNYPVFQFILGLVFAEEVSKEFSCNFLATASLSSLLKAYACELTTLLSSSI